MNKLIKLKIKKNLILDSSYTAISADSDALANFISAFFAVSSMNNFIPVLPLGGNHAVINNPYSSSVTNAVNAASVASQKAASFSTNASTLGCSDFFSSFITKRGAIISTLPSKLTAIRGTVSVLASRNALSAQPMIPQFNISSIPALPSVVNINAVRNLAGVANQRAAAQSVSSALLTQSVPYSSYSSDNIVTGALDAVTDGAMVSFITDVDFTASGENTVGSFITTPFPGISFSQFLTHALSSDTNTLSVEFDLILSYDINPQSGEDLYYCLTKAALQSGYSFQFSTDGTIAQTVKVAGATSKWKTVAMSMQSPSEISTAMLPGIVILSPIGGVLTPNYPVYGETVSVQIIEGTPFNIIPIN